MILLSRPSGRSTQVETRRNRLTLGNWRFISAVSSNADSTITRNPYIEEQAIDRAHRIGQLRPVKVHRILVPDTVEDRILDLQRRKRELIEGALDENASRNISRLGTRELAFLFVSEFPETH